MGVYDIKRRESVWFTNDELWTKEDQVKIGLCIYKIWYGEKYIIWYGVTLWGSYYHFKKGYDNYNPALDVYHKLIYEHMRTHPGPKLRVELLQQPDTAYDLLKQQQLLLDEAEGDKDCMNRRPFEPYIPKMNKSTKDRGNFPAQAYASYRRFISGERYLKHKFGI